MSRAIRLQLAIFTALTLAALLGLSWYYLRLPGLLGLGQYTLNVDLPSSGGLYATANVTYRGTTVGKVTSVEPDRRGVRAVLAIEDGIRIPVDATANVHSVSAIGEQYLDLVSDSEVDPHLTNGQTITRSTVPQPVGPLIDEVNRTVAALPEEKLAALLHETSTAIGGLGPSLQRLVDSTQAIGGETASNVAAIGDIIDESGALLDSQVSTGADITAWAARVRSLATQTAQRDEAVRGTLQLAAPTANQVKAVFDDVSTALPQVLANTEIVFDLLERYHAGVEQGLVFLPQGASIAETVTSASGYAGLDFRIGLNQPPPCLTGFLPVSEWRSPADTSTKPPPVRSYCKIPQDFQGNVVRGARNIPCADVPGKRAASPEECRDDRPYVPMGTNPWYGDPNQILTCPAPAARCDQPVKPGLVIPAPSVNNGLNPAPADRVPPAPRPVSDPPTIPRGGTVSCSHQQPNPCTYTPASTPVADVYSPFDGLAVSTDGTTFTVKNSVPHADAWKEMLAPATG